MPILFPKLQKILKPYAYDEDHKNLKKEIQVIKVPYILKLVKLNVRPRLWVQTTY